MAFLRGENQITHCVRCLHVIHNGLYRFRVGRKCLIELQSYRIEKGRGMFSAQEWACLHLTSISIRIRSDKSSEKDNWIMIKKRKRKRGGGFCEWKKATAIRPSLGFYCLACYFCPEKCYFYVKNFGCRKALDLTSLQEKVYKNVMYSDFYYERK